MTTTPTTGASLPEASPTAGMNIAQRILHVGGRNNAAGYVEFGSIQAVEALVRQVLRDLPAAPQQGETAECIETVTLQQRINEITELFGSLREAASILGLDAGYLSRLRSGSKADPSADVLAKLGLQRKVAYTLVRRKYTASALIQRTRSA